MNSNSAYQSALEYEQNIREYLISEPALIKIPREKIDYVIDCVLVVPIISKNRFNFIVKDMSIKPFNINFNLNKALNSMIDTLVLVPTTYSELDLAKLVLYAIYKIIQLSTLKLTDAEVIVLCVLHRINAYNKSISDNEIVDVINDGIVRYGYNKLTPDQIRSSVEHLSTCGCIARIDDRLCLNENVVLL